MAVVGGPNVIDDGLVLSLDGRNYKSYPGSGTTWYDLTDNNHDCSIGGASFQDASSPNPSFGFNGSTQFIDAPALSGVTTDWTVGVWFYPQSVSNYENVIDCNYGYAGSSGNIGPRLEMASTGLLVWIWSGDTGNNSNYYYSTVKASGLAANTWHYAALSRNSSNQVIGAIDTEYTTGMNTVGSPSSTFVDEFSNINIARGFSNGGAERYLTGNVSTVHVYNRALSQAELRHNYNALRSRVGL